MFQASDLGVYTSTTATAPTSQPTPKRKQVRHVLLGDADAVKLDIHLMHIKGYAEATAWSQPQPTGNPGEVVRVLIKTPIATE
ncbi:hypothetical protein [Almyronema epifaneia]|uniref:Uncharacterized protein n=1 Tax=Almyronema epifaneia S1 TaxID=2991925 RepID=A0ABW6ID62_9CYAN